MNRKIGVLMSYVAMIFEVLSTLLLTPFILRTLGQAEYGVYKLTAAIVAYLLLLDLGVGNSVVRFISKFRVKNDKNQCQKFLGIATLFYLAVASITVILGIVLIWAFPYAFAKGLSNAEVALGQKLLFITVLNATVTLGTAGFANTLIAYEYFAFQKGCLIVQTIVKMAFTYFGLFMGYGSLAIVTVQLFTTIVCRLVYVFFVLYKINLKPIFKEIDGKFIKEVVIYSSFILLQMVATQINACADQVLLGAFVSSSASIIGVYGVGVQIVTYFQSIGNSMTGVLMPGLVRLVESESNTDRIFSEMVRIGRLIFMVLGLIWVGFLVLGKQFVILWAGQDNVDAYLVCAILMTAHLFILTESIGTQILWAMNQHKEQAILKICVVIINIFLTIILIRWNALIGATIGTFISLAVGDVIVMNIIFVKKIRINIFKYYRGLFSKIVMCLICTGVVGVILNCINLVGWIGFVVKGSLITISYVLLMWFYGLNVYEKNLFKTIFARFGKTRRKNG